MPDLKEMEVGVMFWAGPDAVETIRRVKSVGVHCGQLGIPGSMPMAGLAKAWRAALAAEQPPVCFQAFPDAHTTTIGRTTWYNRQRSVQDVICDGFGRNPSADFTTDGVACGLFAVAVGLASDHLGAFVEIGRAHV